MSLFTKFSTCLLLLEAASSLFAQSPITGLEPIPFSAVKVQDSFWAPRIKINREKVLPHDFQFCEGRIRNFKRAAGLLDGKFEGIFYDDSDVYKVIEGAAYSLAQERDANLEKTVDDVIDLIAAAQLPDGYLYTFYTVNKTLDKRWTDEKQMHETYCAGHLIEAAVAYYQATGKRKLLDTAIRLADHIDSVFGPQKKHDAPGHQEIELALIKLWRVTGQDRYLKLAQFFIEQRGHYDGRPVQGEYSQDLLPIREQREITGHAVRAMYFYSGVADVAAITKDSGYIQTMDRIWSDVTGRKMYITGGIGPSAQNEGFTVPYDLPNESAYAETCAAVGMSFWNQRMSLLHADAKYADVVERELYNGALAGVALEGDKFFYVNPLESKGKHHRRPWFNTACCPVNIVRYLPTVGGYAYAKKGSDLYVNQFLASNAAFDFPDSKFKIRQQTEYPWQGRVELFLEPAQASKFTLHLRIPGWCQNASPTNNLYNSNSMDAGKNEVVVRVNGKAIRKLKIENGYAVLQRTWKSGDRVELNLPMAVRRVHANPAVKADAGRVALQRGPIVYCVEGVDNQDRARSLFLPEHSPISTRFQPELLGGLVVLTAPAQLRVDESSSRPVVLTAIPYYAWDNRSAGDMQVWLPQSLELAEMAKEIK